jgi:septum formation protein
MLGPTYEVHPSTIDVKSIRDTDPAALTKKLTEAKARKVASAVDDAAVVSGDTVVAKDTKLFEKLRSNDEAVEFLRELSDSASKFVTSLTVLRSDTGRMPSAVETSEIKFRRLEDRELRPISGFALCGGFAGESVLRFAEAVSGSYNFIAAMPVSRLAVFLREQGVEV